MEREREEEGERKKLPGVYRPHGMHGHLKINNNYIDVFNLPANQQK